MATKQGDLSLLQHPVAQRLLQSNIPARFAYTWTDGTPRVIPIGWHWNGTAFVIGTPANAPKLKAIRNGTKVSLTIDESDFPPAVLLVRGSVSLEVVQGLPAESQEWARRYLGEEAGNAWIEQAKQWVKQTVNISISPEWVGLIDFQTRFPSTAG
jgi:hypothetical protein